jgi:hypothetical protein
MSDLSTLVEETEQAEENRKEKEERRKERTRGKVEDVLIVLPKLWDNVPYGAPNLRHNLRRKNRAVC